MLRNSGPYGPNDMSMNTESSIDVTESPTNVNISSNMKNVNKIPNQTMGFANNQYNLQDYPPCNYSQMNSGSNFVDYPNLNDMSLHPAFYSQMSHTSSFSPWTNGMKSLDIDVQSHLNRFNENLNNTVVETNKITTNEDDGSMNSSIASITNSQQSLLRNHLLGDRLVTDTRQGEEFTEENIPRNKPLMDSVKRKSLENTVRLIENILISTAKNNENSSKKYPISDENNDLLNTATNTNNNYENKTSTSNQGLSDNCLRTMLMEDQNQDTNSDISDNDVSENNKDPLQIKMECVNEMECGDEQDTNTLDNVQCVDVDPSIVVKVEEISSWADVIGNPFVKDRSGVAKDEAGDVDVIDSTFSIQAAIEVINNGTDTSNFYECPHCPLLFQHPKRFLIHTKWHSFGLTNERRQELQRERKMNRKRRKEERALDKMNESTEGGEEKMQCKDCDKEFLSKSSLKNHRYRFHPNPRYSKECPICNTLIQGQAAMQAHKLTHKGEIEFKCKECPKVFKYSHSLQKHVGVHREKTHQCQECPKAFGSINLLKMHMKCHERAQRGHTFRCSFCGKGFYEVYCLQVHERTHTGERPFLCNICNTSFNTNSGLNRHVKVSHNSSKPYSCATCHRSFVSSSIRDRHVLRAHGDPSLFQYMCTLCPCKYLSAKYLRKHIDKVHPKSKVKRKKRADNDDDSEYDASSQV